MNQKKPNLLIEHIGQNRFFVDLWKNCNYGCSYCYIPNTKASIKNINDRIIFCVNTLFSHSEFKPGRNGTLISISPHAEPFYNKFRSDAIFKLIDKLVIFNNPIQFATKSKLSSWHIENIDRIRRYRNQIVGYVSISTISKTQFYENGTSKPSDRFNNIRLLNDKEIPSCLFIKPVLPKITILDLNLFIEYFDKYNVRVGCVGDLYANKAIMENIPTIYELPQIKNRKLPGKNSDKFLLIKNDNEIETIIDTLQKNTNASIFKSAPCVIAWYFKTYSPTLTWRRFPELCVQCKDCEQSYLLSGDI